MTGFAAEAATPWQASFAARKARGERSLVGDRGLQHPAETPSNPQGSPAGGAQSGAPGAVLPPDVLELARRLAALPAEARQALAALLAGK